MISRFVRIGLIILLLLSLLIAGNLLINETSTYQCPIEQSVATAILFLTQLILLIILYLTRKSKILLIVFIVNIGLFDYCEISLYFSKC